jgi:hypothetical protein
MLGHVKLDSHPRLSELCYVEIELSKRLYLLFVRIRPNFHHINGLVETA